MSKKEEKILGIPTSELRRQLSFRKVHDVDSESKLDPINPDYGKTVGILDPVIEGGKKILNDPETLQMVRKILRRDRNQEN